MKKVLIVDDDADIRDAIAAVLKGSYEFQQADGRDAALKAFTKYKPDLVLLDVMMDTMSTGFELAREMKKAHAASKILMLTSVDEKTSIDFKSEAGNADWLPVDDYLSKPVVPKTLLEKAKKLLS